MNLAEYLRRNDAPFLAHTGIVPQDGWRDISGLADLIDRLGYAETTILLIADALVTVRDWHKFLDVTPMHCGCRLNQHGHGARIGCNIRGGTLRLTRHGREVYIMRETQRRLNLPVSEPFDVAGG